MIQSREGAPTFFGSSKKVQKKSRDAAAAVSGTAIAPPIVHDALRSTGSPIDTATRTFMETRFGRDFSDVRLHTGAQAAQSARAVDALAFTVGSDIVMDQTHYDPATGRGAHLLAHELAHVAQQSGEPISSRFGKLIVGSAHDSAERDAEHAADRVMNGSRAFPAHHGPHGYLRRQPAGHDDEPKKDPTPWLHKGDWVLNPQATLPGLGTGSLEDVHKGWCAVSGKCGKDSPNPCPTGWQYHRSGPYQGKCCEGFTTDPNRCCPPQDLIEQYLNWTCRKKPAPEKPKAETPKPEAPQQAPAPPSGEINRDLKLKSPPVPDLTVDRPIHFILNQPAAAVSSEASLRASLTTEGKSDLTRVIDWLVKWPQFGVQLTGMASVEGPPAHNLQLGDERARSVANVLSARGIDRNRLAEPVGAADDCPALSTGIHNCGDSHASKTVDPNDRQVRARLFVLPEPATKRP
jgi:outer membrane protein OmpA-like peptidoglycan-associated protein